MNNYRLILTGFSLFMLSSTTAAQEARWYDAAQINRGQVVFQQNCASCHGANGQAQAGWKEAVGEASAPPLDGSAHTWHHSLEQLKKTIQKGGIQLGGAMPGFEDQLSDDDIDSVIAFFQSKWPQEIYAGWSGRFVKVAENTGQKDDVTRLLKLRLGTNDIEPVKETPLEGVYQTQFGDKIAYLIDGGRYVFIGDLIDLERAQNLTEISRRDIVKETLDQVPDSEYVIYPANGAEKTYLNVFTDTSCAYCRKLHQEINYLQDAGITVKYFPFPRGGNRGPGYQDLKSVWCADDPLQAMHIAKGVSEGKLVKADCAKASIVDKGFQMGRKLGITGTPSLYSAAGTKFNGYVPYNELIPALLGEL